MHRIDTSTAQRDKFGQGKNGFTRGNPQTGTPATQLDYLYCDAIQEEIANTIESAGIKLDKSKHDQLATAIKEFVSKGSVKLNSSTDSTSETEAATPLAVKKTYDLAECSNTKIDDLKQKFTHSDEHHQTEMRSPDNRIQFLVRNDGVSGLYSMESKDWIWAFSNERMFRGVIDVSQIITFQNHNDNGFVKLPGGIIIQWLTATTNDFGVLDVMLPISFPSRLFSVFINEASSGDWANDCLYSYGCSINQSNLSTIRVHSRLTANGGLVTNKRGKFSLFAIGC